MSGKSTRLTLKSKLIIYEYKERFPQLSLFFISDFFNIDIEKIEKMFNKGYLIIPSKINNYGQRKKKI